MSERSGPEQSHHRRRGHRQKPKGGNLPNDSHIEEQPPLDEHLRGIASLERLRDRVEVASRELRKLREENAALAARLSELESRPFLLEGETTISFDEDPEVLRRKVTGFIEAIDRYLQKEENLDEP